MTVTLGGVFLAGRDPDALMDWFETGFGMTFQRHGDGGSTTFPAGDGVAVFAVHRARDDAPAPPRGAPEAEPYGRRPMMLTLRVDDLDAVLARLRSAGVGAAGPAEYGDFGRFAWVRSPEDHDIEIWQP